MNIAIINLKEYEELKIKAETNEHKLRETLGYAISTAILKSRDIVLSRSTLEKITEEYLESSMEYWNKTIKKQ